MLTRSLAVFSLFLTVRVLCARYSIIPDCDEVFNYWEPLHYLTHGYGLQTWEYSPVYAIRSWAYEALHALVIRAIEPLVVKKYDLFYGLRYAFSALSALAETKLYSSLRKNVSGSVAAWYAVFSLASTGMFHSSVAFLPSSFAMHAFTLALANYTSLQNRSHAVVRGITWTVIGGLLGWPFCLVLVMPFGVNYFVHAVARKRFTALLASIGKVLFNTASILASIVAYDSTAYKKFVVVPANIVLYNVLNATEDSGPDIFGTEPWWFYPLNLSLNFNFIFYLAAISVIVPFALAVCNPTKIRYHWLDLLTLVSPFYVWLGIFIAQPHKEERFMYVAYPSLCVNAAIAMEFMLVFSSKLLNRKVITFSAAVLIIAISLSRSVALAKFYSAPIELYKQIPDNAAGNICVGREWYRYPSSYFIDNNLRLKFVKSGFSGLLPGEFIETNSTSWIDRKGIYVPPEGMNDKNLEDPGKYTPVSDCDFMVDLDSAVDEEAGEIRYTASPEWKKIRCLPFLNNAESSGIGRILYHPSSFHALTKTNLVYDNYCLLERSHS
ncbi:alpha-1,2-mannosyltransferase Alg9p [Trichomonascus vanleenenianus]|uniref:dolichyl-P-Man:Man(6)GlcNAc(2)-PP-dolichol alpha-1,2-mannosyltransferase n=1 Tax=Trichomonascus vanleenenianus TaxID=2268995 RepID=UPI003ECAA51B